LFRLGKRVLDNIQMKLKQKLAGLALIALTTLPGCRIGDYVYYGDPRAHSASWVVSDKYHVSKNGETYIVKDKETGERWKRIVGDAEGRDRYGRMIHDVQRFYAPDGRTYVVVQKFPEWTDKIMNGDQGLGDALEEEGVDVMKRF
jgi:hypothetical protein